MTNQVVNPAVGGTGGQTRRFAYNYRGQMTALHDRDGRMFAYEFDGDGNRIRQSLNDCLETRFVYDGPNVVLELTASNEVATAYINGLGIDQPIERIGFIAGQPRFRHVYHADALGSIVALTDESGTTTKTYAYEAFGRIRAEIGDTPLNRITYTAREALGDGRLLYYRYRVLNPHIGRFVERDPIGLGGGPNEYIYVGNAPHRYIDPMGLFLFDVQIPGTQISADDCWEMATKVNDFLLQGGFTGRSFCKCYKDPTEGPGAANHCMFGCLLQLGGCGLQSAGSEIFGDFTWNDLIDNYIGVAYGWRSRDYKGCHEKCAERHCSK